MEQRDRHPFLDANHDLIGPETGHSGILDPFEFAELITPFGHRKEINALAKIGREHPGDFLVRCERRALNLQALRIHAVFGGSRKGEPGI